MTITRREMWFLLPGLFPAAVALDAFPAEDNSMPSAFYAFDKLPVQTLDHAEIRTPRTITCILRCGSFGRELSSLRSTAELTAWVRAAWDSFIRMMSMESRMLAMLRPRTSS